MDSQVVTIDRRIVDRLIRLMVVAEGYCSNAVSYRECDPHDEATRSYAGASGYARATLRECIQELETQL